uniref:Rad60-SLD domain-containing protein n=1 Tax=Parastrongyloides trichosuri TaxID=131310 RepID=A0A0N4ZMM1_PARTI
MYVSGDGIVYVHNGNETTIYADEETTIPINNGTKNTSNIRGINDNIENSSQDVDNSQDYGLIEYPNSRKKYQNETESSSDNEVNDNVSEDEFSDYENANIDFDINDSDLEIDHSINHHFTRRSGIQCSSIARKRKNNSDNKVQTIHDNDASSMNSKNRSYLSSKKYKIQFGNKNLPSIGELSVYVENKFTSMSKYSFYQLRTLLKEHEKNQEYKKIILICLNIKLCQTIVDVIRINMDIKETIRKSDLEFLIMDTFGIEKREFIDAAGVSLDDAINFGVKHGFFSLSNGDQIKVKYLLLY